MRTNENYTKIIIDKNEKNVLYNLYKTIDNMCYMTASCAECDFNATDSQCLLRLYKKLLNSGGIIAEDEIK